MMLLDNGEGGKERFIYPIDGPWLDTQKANGFMA